MSVFFSDIPCFPDSPKVVVIGSGIGGLTTAYRLHQAGMDVELYEARGRVGGRIFTATINGKIAELGGQNIADGGEIPINLNRLIDEFELKRASSTVYLKESYFNGTDLTPIDEILKTQNIHPETLRKRLNDLALTHPNMKEILDELVSPAEPLHNILSVRMAAYEGGPCEKLSSLYIETLYHMLLGGVCSAHQGAEDASQAGIDLVTIEGGNSLLPEKLAEALQSHLHLNMPLKKVAKTQTGQFHLTFENGLQIQSDLLVLAIPCSVYNQITFEPGIIPSPKLDAIEHVQYGENAKIMVPFPSRSSQTTTTVIGDDVLSFYDQTKQILTIYYTLSKSFFSPETLASAYAQARPLMELGFENCPPFKTPDYAQDAPHLSYEGAIGYSWPNDPYAKGSYSYIASGQEQLLTETMTENGETFRALFAPIDNSLYFVGEHASILFDVPGTMEAACESGERIARSILQTHRS